MAHLFRGLPEQLTFFTDQFIVEEIQDLCRELYDNRQGDVIPEWVSSRLFVDTGERMGRFHAIGHMIFSNFFLTYAPISKAFYEMSRCLL